MDRMSDLVTAQEAAKLCCISAEYVRHLARIYQVEPEWGISPNGRQCLLWNPVVVKQMVVTHRVVVKQRRFDRARHRRRPLSEPESISRQRASLMRRHSNLEAYRQKKLREIAEREGR